MIYNIPVSHLDKLQKQVQRIKNKGANITFEVGPEIYIEDPKIEGVFHKCREVEVEGSYKINGWEFIATIEHGEGRNIIRAISDELATQIPDRYWTCGKECEHCNKVRDRKDTYLVYNEEHQEWKQVGKTCLKDYTKGLDAETCAQLAEVIDSCKYLADEADEEAFIGGGFRGPTYDYIKADKIKKIAYKYVQENGYKKDGVTANALADIIYSAKSGEAPKASDEEMAEINQWVEELRETSPYFWNAKTAWSKEYLESRDLALISSLISVFFKDKAVKAQQAAEAERLAADTSNVTVGSIGDRITITVKNARVLYTKSNSHASYYAEPSNVWEIIDEEGHTFIWSTSIGTEIKEGDKITATVKDFKEFRGRQQTVLTRGKINN